MTANSYDTGRLNLPFVGIATFGKRPYVDDWSQIKADVAVMGAPSNCARLGSMRRLCALCVRSTSGWASMVPMKLLAGLVPALPLRSQHTLPSAAFASRLQVVSAAPLLARALAG